MILSKHRFFFFTSIKFYLGLLGLGIHGHDLDTLDTLDT